MNMGVELDHEHVTECCGTNKLRASNGFLGVPMNLESTMQRRRYPLR